MWPKMPWMPCQMYNTWLNSVTSVANTNLPFFSMMNGEGTRDPADFVDPDLKIDFHVLSKV